jgi:hypothetical protein
VIDIARDSVTIKKTKDIPIESVRNHYDAIYSFQKIVNLRGYKEDKKVLEAFYLSSASHDYPDNHQFFVNCDKNCPFRQKTLKEFSDTKNIIELDSFENIINCRNGMKERGRYPIICMNNKSLIVILRC